MPKHKKHTSRRSGAVREAMSASVTTNGSGWTASGWLPVDVDNETAFQVLLETVSNGSTKAQDDFDQQLLSADRKVAGKAGGGKSAQTLPEGLWPAFVDAVAVINQSRHTQRQAMSIIRQTLDNALVGITATAASVSFLVWYSEDNRKRNSKLIAMLDRTFSDSGEFCIWLKTLPK